MEFFQQRIHKNQTYSIAYLYNAEDTFNSFVIEDPPRKIKIPKITGIPAGRFKLIIRKEDLPLTLRHREAYAKAGWTDFKYHIEVSGIPGFQFVYVHAGNDSEDTEGCVTPGYAFDLSKPKDNQSLSIAATHDFYKIVYPLLEAGKEVWLNVIDQK